MRALQRGQHPAVPGHTFVVQGRPLQTLNRVYYDIHALTSAIRASEGNLRTWALCLGTRHHDGHVREACVRELARHDRPWAIPFVVQLLGDYVVEIVLVVLAAFADVDADVAGYVDFARENPGFMVTTRRRATSYWDCYYRSRYPLLRDYPAIVALDAIEHMSGVPGKGPKREFGPPSQP